MSSNTKGYLNKDISVRDIFDIVFKYNNIGRSIYYSVDSERIKNTENKSLQNLM